MTTLTARLESKPYRAKQILLFYDLIAEFHKQTGVPVIINTSFNVRGEPIVCTPEDAFRCFMRTGMDYSVMKTHDVDWQREFELD